MHAIAKKSDVEVSVAISVGASAGVNSDPSQDSNNNVTLYRGAVRKGDKRNSDRLLQIVSEIKPDVVNIQYERGLYRGRYYDQTYILETCAWVNFGSVLQNVPSTNSIHAAILFFLRTNTLM